MGHGRHSELSSGRSSFRTNSSRTNLSRTNRMRAFIGGGAAVCVAGAVALSMTSAEAAPATIKAQLTLSGVAYADSPTGGSVVGVHPGDSVIFTASTIPTKGAPSGLGNALSGTIQAGTHLQIKVTSGNLPGVKYPYTLGKVTGCGGESQLALKSLKKGTYSFKYTASRVYLDVVGGILGGSTKTCKRTPIELSKDSLGKLTKDKVKVSDTTTYSGSVVVSTNPPKGSIGVQLPSHSVSVKAGPVHTSVTVPGVKASVTNPVPALSSTVKSVVNKVGGVVNSATAKVGGTVKSAVNGVTKAGGSNGTSGVNVNYTPPGVTIPQKVMKNAVGYGGGGGGVAPGSNVGGGGTGGRIYTAPVPQVTSTAAAMPAAAASKGSKTVELSSKQTLGGKQLPVLLAIIAILALGMVTAVYARLRLMRRSS